ncbi:MAG: BT4734/BF3469 family protein [Candidatus Pacearchaeota archaeon]|jgi:hypothetical protein|nr:hypothetical protein [Clostridia bacterium]
MSKFIVSEFPSVKVTTPSGNRDITEILADIKNGKFKNLVEPIFKETDKKKREDLKYKLPLFTPTGQFITRSINGMAEYNGFICLDIDHVENVEDLKKRATKLNYVFAAFITPSGNGLKVLIPTTATKETYKETELKVSAAFAIDAGGIRDKHCHDIARIQYVSYDPELYLNENAKVIF